MLLSDILKIAEGFEKSFLEVIFSLRHEILEKLKNTDVVGYNPFGEKSRAFDEEISKLLIERFVKHGFKGAIVTEEKTVKNISDEVIFIDPVDGSLNAARGINIFAFEACYAKKPGIDFLSASIIWNIPFNQYFIALSTRGAYKCSQEGCANIEARRKDFEDTVIEVGNTSGDAFLKIKKIGTTRILGSIAYAFTKLVEGDIDAIFDNSGKLKFTDVAACILLLREAKAHCYWQLSGDLRSNPRVKIIASTDRNLFEELLSIFEETK